MNRFLSIPAWIQGAVLLMAAALVVGCSGEPAKPVDPVSNSGGTSQAPAVDPPPSVEISSELMSLKQVQAEVAASGKVVVLDLWATW